MKKIRDCLLIMALVILVSCLWFWLTAGNPFLHFGKTILLAVIMALFSALLNLFEE